MTTAMADAIVAGATRRADPLTVLYDERCPLCRRLRAWLAGQPTTVPVAFVAADSPDSHRRFPSLEHRRTTTVLTVVSPDGEVFEGERAWIVCAWMLPAWQPVAEHLGGVAGRFAVRLVARVVDGYRHRTTGTYGDPCDGGCRRVAEPS